MAELFQFLTINVTLTTFLIRVRLQPRQHHQQTTTLAQLAAPTDQRLTRPTHLTRPTAVTADPTTTKTRRTDSTANETQTDDDHHDCASRRLRRRRQAHKSMWATSPIGPVGILAPLAELFVPLMTAS